MPVTITKNAGDTVLTLNNFESLTPRGASPSQAIGNILGDEEDAILLKFLGPSMTVDVSWVVMDEDSTVVSGTGSPVTKATAQILYLYETLWSKGEDQFSDQYRLTIDYSSTTFSRTGVLTKIDCIQTSKDPLIFKATASFLVGNVPGAVLEVGRFDRGSGGVGGFNGGIAGVGGFHLH